MSEETKQLDREPQKEAEFVEPVDGIFRTYANHYRLGWTGHDVRILFGELIDVSPAKYTIEETAHVTMSWLEAKSLASALQDLVAKYESKNRPLKPVHVPE